MKKAFVSGLMCLFVAALAHARVRCASEAPSDSRSAPASSARGLTLAPGGFIENRGQAPRAIRYYARGGSYDVALTAGEAVFSGSAAGRLALRFVGARRDARIEGLRPAVTKVNFIRGNDPSQWRNGVFTFDEVVYRDLWPGIDLVFRRSAERLKYDFVVRAGSDPADIRLAWRGATGLSVDEGGNLQIRTTSGMIMDERPYTYQEVDGKRTAVESRFRLARGGYGFAVGPYDRRLPLVIDPGLEFSTFLGGNKTDFARAIALDSAGNIYVAGSTSSSDFPVTPDAFDATWAARGINSDAFVAKLDPTGRTLLYATFLGGTSTDRAESIAVDRGGNVYVAGSTSPAVAGDPNFPTSPSAFDSVPNGSDVFLTKLTPAGTLAYSTFLGGTSSEFVVNNAVAVDDTGNVWVAGSTESSNFPVKPGAFSTTKSGFSSDGFVARFDTNQSGEASLTYSSFFGGSSFDTVRAIARGSDGTVYLVSSTLSSNMPITPGAYDTSYAATIFTATADFHIARLDPTRSGMASLMLGTYLGARGRDIPNTIALDAGGNIYVAGTSNSPSYPTTENAYDRVGAAQADTNGIPNFAPDVASDGVVSKLSADGSTLLYSTYLSSCADDSIADLAVDAAGNVYVIGLTASPRFPTTFGAYDSSYNGGSFDVFLTKFNPNVSGVNSLVYSTFLGGNNVDQLGSVAVDPAGNAYIAGTTASRDFPATASAFDPTFNHPFFGDTDGFVAKFDLTPAVQLEAIAAELLALAEEILNKGQGEALHDKLENARDQVARGNLQAAAGQIRSFIHQVHAFVAAGTLTIDDGETLVNAANRILAQLFV
jgi:hypothetical protein